MAGLTVNGFEAKTLTEIKAEMESALKAEFGAINTNPDTTFGQIIIALAPSLKDVWERLEELFYSQYPASADGFALDSVCALTGIYRLPAVKSTVFGALKGNEGTNVPAATQVSVNATGDIFKTTAAREITIERTVRMVLTPTDGLTGDTYGLNVDGVLYAVTGGVDGLPNTPTQTQVVTKLIVKFTATPITGVTITNLTTSLRIDVDNYEDYLLIENLDELVASDWYSPALFQALIAGPLEVAIGTLTEIETPVGGFTACTNFIAEVTGRDIETDSELRIRRTASLSIIGAATVPAIQARILQEVDDVTACLVVENDTMDDDGDSRPAKSFECIVSGGTDLDIAEKIWELKPAGIATIGTGGNIVNQNITDIDGNSQMINFSRPTPVVINVIVIFEQNTEKSFPAGGVNAIKTAIKAMGDLQEIGDDVIIQKYFTPIYSINGVGDVTTLTLNAGVINIAIAPNEVATFALGNISVTDATP